MSVIRDHGLPLHPQLEDWERQSLYCLLMAIQQQSDGRLLEELSRLLSRQSGVLSLWAIYLAFTRSYDQTLAYPRHPAWIFQCVSLSDSVVCRRSGVESYSVSAVEKGGVFVVPSFSCEKGAPGLTVTASHQFSGSLGFVPYSSCCVERYKSLVNVNLDDGQSIHVRISGDGCRIEFASSLSFTVDLFSGMDRSLRSPFSRKSERAVLLDSL